MSMENEKKMDAKAGFVSPEDFWKKTNSLITGIFVLFMLALFPLLYHDYYFDILVFRYQVYYVLVIVLCIMILINTLVFFYRDWKENDGVNFKIKFSKIDWKSIRGVDWAMFAFVAAVFVSTFQSDYFYESFWGNEGRLCGLFLIFLYGISYFIVTRCFHFKKLYVDLFLLAGIAACTIGILQYFQFNPLGLKTGLSDGDAKIFASTIGNINSYTAYVALLVGVGSVLFCNEDRIVRKGFYFLATAIFLLGLITGISDNAYLTLGTLFGLLPLYLFTNIRGVKHYTILLAILATEFQIVGWLNQTFPNHVIGIDGLFLFVSGFKGLPFIIAFLWGIVVLLQIIEIKKKKNGMEVTSSNIGRWIWLAFIAIALMAIAYVLYDVNVLGNVKRYGSLKSYLLFNDQWGTNRGYVWSLSLRIFDTFPIHHKLFGSGPDTFGIITVTEYMEEMYGKFYEKYDSAHNEYIQYLITIGVVGLTSYLTFLGSAVLHMIRKAKRNPVLMAVMFGSLCYMIQATVNISVPIVAPIMMTLIMVGVSKKNEIIE